MHSPEAETDVAMEARRRALADVKVLAIAAMDSRRPSVGI
jgi:hypothetical protein